MVIALNTYGTTSLSDWMFCCYFTVEAESIPGWFSVRSVINSSEWAFFAIYRQIRNTRCVQSTHKGVNLRPKDVTQAQQQRPRYPTVTLTWHASKYSVHKLHQRILSPGMRANTRYINSIRGCLWWSLCTCYLLACHVRVTVGDSGLCCFCLCDVFWAQINSLVSWFCTSAVGLVLFHSLCTCTTCVSCFRCKPLEHLVQALFIIWRDNISLYLVSALVLSAEGIWSSHDLTLAGNVEALLPTPREKSGRCNLWILSRWKTAST